MENIIVARLAVSAATYAIDKPYDYIVPEAFAEKISPGIRVSIPFGRGNRRCEGVVLSINKSTDREMLKCIDAVLDESPIITKDQIKLALWMHERFFCTVYEAFRAMLPAGLWFKDGQRKVNDKVLKFACLNVSAEEAMEIASTKRLRSPKQAKSSLKALSAQENSICFPNKDSNKKIMAPLLFTDMVSSKSGAFFITFSG